MTLLEMVIKEYISIVELLIEDHDIENERIILEKEKFKKLLEKYAYLKVNEKTKIYKQLNFIIHDKNNYTMPIRQAKSIVRKVIINYNTYLIVKRLYETKI